MLPDSVSGSAGTGSRGRRRLPPFANGESIYSGALNHSAAIDGRRSPSQHWIHCGRRRRWLAAAACAARDLPLHPPCAAARLGHQPPADGRARAADPACWRAAGRDRLGRRTDRRRRRRGHERGTRRRGPGHGGPAGTRAGGPRGRAGRGARRRAARTVDLPVAVARTTRPARQRDDPREGADAGARAVRGLRVLRQAHACAARGLDAAPLARDAQLRPRAERDRTGQLRHASRAVFAVGRRRAAARGTTLVRRGSEVLRRRVPAVPLALARDAHADVPGDGPRARGLGQGGQALRARPAPARSLPLDLPQSVRRGSRVDDPSRHLGLRARTARARRRSTPPMPGSPSARCEGRSRSAR